MQDPRTSQLTVQRMGQDELVDGMHPYEALDPFTLSISQRVRNNRRQGTIHSVDEIGGVPKGIVARRQLRLSHESNRSSQSLNRTPGGQSRSSLESTRPPGNPTLTERQGYNTPIPQAQVPSSIPFPPARRNALDTNAAPGQSIHALESEDIPQAPVTQSSAEGRAQQHPIVQTNGNAAPRHHFSSQSLLTRPARMWSFSSSSERNLPRLARMSTFAQISDSFLPGDDEEKNTSPSSLTSTSPEIPLRVYVATFLTSILPHQIYLHCLLRLPYMYFSRVNQIFEDAHLTLEQIKEMALRDTVNSQSKGPGSKMPGAYLRLKKNWEQFIDNLMREWKTINIISGLLLSGILTIFQVEGAQTDSITHYMAFWSLLCALFSLLYGCFFIIRFSGMQRVYKATEWAIEAQRDQTMFWNVWIMLAMPAIWLVWSILAYIACIMAFMWRVRPSQPAVIVSPQIGPATDAGFRIFICCVFGIGVVYAVLIINTLRHYGSKMDKMWTSRIAGFRRQQGSNQTPDEPGTPSKSPPVRGVEIVPPTPPTPWVQPHPASPPSNRFSPVIPSRPSPPSGTRPLSAKAPHSPSSPSPLGRSQIATTTVFSESRHRLSPDIFDSMQDSLQNFEDCGERALPPEGQALGLSFPNLGELDDLSSPEAEDNRPKNAENTTGEIVVQLRPPDSESNSVSMDVGVKEESGEITDTALRPAV